MAEAPWQPVDEAGRPRLGTYRGACRSLSLDALRGFSRAQRLARE